MKVLMIEDDAGKAKAISSHLKRRGVAEENILHARSMTDFAAALSQEIGLFIIDFKLPSVEDGVASQNGKAILETIIKAGKNDALMLAISSYPDDFQNLRGYYESHGCILADYSKQSSWQSTLDHLVVQLNKNLRFDFVIFCALQKERAPYATLLEGCKSVIRGGIDCLDVTINKKKGTIILLPQMGLVNAAVIAGVAIDRFRPSFVGMSGICGGFKDRAELGGLRVSSMAYEYQSGKWASDGFEHEPYQVPTDHVTLTKLRALLEKDGLISELEEGLGRVTRPPKQIAPSLGIFTSGSAVIADKQFMDQVKIIHRKVNALDMEVYAIKRAAELSVKKPPCICAKTVVDLGTSVKNDRLHTYGSYISAKFLIAALSTLFSPASATT